MKSRTKNIINCCLMGGVLLVLCLLCLFLPNEGFSYSERRPLAVFPDVNKKTILSGKAMNDFEKYTQDRFPFRDTFRQLKTLTAMYVFQSGEINGIFFKESYAVAVEYPLDESSLNYAIGRFRNVYDLYLKGNGAKLYFSIIPDKAYFTAGVNGYPAVDYDKLVSVMRNGCDYMSYIDIFPLLSISDYYKTDTHWRQEQIGDVAQALVKGMGGILLAEYTEQVATSSFLGVYYGQSMLPLSAESISYLDSPIITNYSVYDYENDKAIPVYDADKAVGVDPYELYLNGPISLVTIDNPGADTNRELVVFRDSFGSSIAPLIAQAYSKTTLVDIRYINPLILSYYVDFSNCDVLFLYSTSVMNNSATIK